MVVTLTAQALFEFEQVAQACHWTEQQFNDTLIADGCVVLPYYSNNQLIAYLLAQCVCDECELLQISVHPDFKRQGIGYDLMSKLMTLLKAQSVHRLLLEVRDRNAAAIALYQKMGFVIDGVRKNYYPSVTGNRENAILMSVCL
jgi:ribosomal-protein-alanine N-acetyltransferase